MRKLLFTFLFLSFAIISARAQTVGANNSDTVMILPFENTSGRPDFNWVGESVADSLSDLLKVPSLNVVSNEERKIIQQRLQVPLTTLPSLATSLKLAREGRASLLVAGRYDIVPAQGETAASVNITAKIIRVDEGRFLSETLPDGKRITRDINLKDALANLQTVEGQLAYQILYQRDKALPFSQNQFIESANKVPARAFEAYIKGLLTPEADIQSREGFFKNAMRLYAEAKTGDNVAEVDKVYADAALELGHLYLNQRQFDQAVNYFSRVPQTDSHYAEAAFYTGLIRWQQNDYEQALAVLRPLAEDLKLTSVYNTIGAIAVQGARAEKKNKGKSDALLKDGLDFLKQAAESAAQGDTASLFNYGLALYLNGNFAEAATQFRPVLAANPRDGEAYYLLAKSLGKIGDASAAEFDNQARRFLTSYAKVETDFQKTNSPDAISPRVVQPLRRDFVSIILSKRQLAPQMQTPANETDALLGQAKDFYKAGRDDDAMQVVRRILAGESMSAEAYLILGNIHLRRGNLEQAVESLKTALFWDNQLIDAHIALGKIFLEKKDCQQAQNYSHSALLIDPNNEDAAALQRSVERCGK